MALAVWPVTLPQALEVGVTDNRQQGFVRFEPSTGPSKQRRRFTATSRFLAGTMLLSQAQRVTFETFYSVTIAEGSLGFEFPDPLDFTSSGVETRFREPPSLTGVIGTPGGAVWRLSVSWEVIR